MATVKVLLKKNKQKANGEYPLLNGAKLTPRMALYVTPRMAQADPP